MPDGAKQQRALLSDRPYSLGRLPTSDCQLARHLHERSDSFRRGVADRADGFHARDLQSYKIKNLAAQHVEPTVAIAQP